MRNLTMWIGLLAALCLLQACAAGQKDGMADAAVVQRVNAGADEPYVDREERVWAADQMYSPERGWGAIGGMTVTRTGMEIEGTPAPEVYLSERFNMEAYRFNVPDGAYSVRLHFAETFYEINAAGLRVFSVRINDETAFEHIDPYAEGGGLGVPVIKRYGPFNVTDGRIHIQFIPKLQNPEVNGIEILHHR